MAGPSGFRSPLPQLGVAVPRDTPSGFRSLAALWLGGASTPAPRTSGYRSVAALWLGGASAPVRVTPPPATRPTGGYSRPRRTYNIIVEEDPILRDDDELISILIPAFTDVILRLHNQTPWQKPPL